MDGESVCVGVMEKVCVGGERWPDPGSVRGTGVGGGGESVGMGSNGLIQGNRGEGGGGGRRKGGEEQWPEQGVGTRERGVGGG